MLQDNFLLALYGHKYLTESNSTSYYLLAFYDHNGELQEDFLKDIYSSLFSNEIDSSIFLGPFDSISFLEKYLIRVATKLKYTNVFFVSLEEYNQIILSSKNLDDMQELLLTKVKQIKVKDSKMTLPFFRN